MKKIILSIAIIAVSFATYAQEATSQKTDKKGGHHADRMEMRIEKMTESLSLSAEQQQQVKTVMTSQHEKMQAQRKANHEAFNNEMKSILSAEQYTKWVAHREEMKKLHQGKNRDKADCRKKCSKKKSKE